MNFFKKKRTNLIDFVKEPPLPWTNRVIIPGAGIIASGWTHTNKVFLFSSTGYSVCDPITGQQELRNYDEDDTAFKQWSKDNLEFTIRELDQTIKVSGLRGGDGNHYTTDGWCLDSFTPVLGEQIVGLQNSKNVKSQNEYWKEFDLISLIRLEYSTLKFGFSPNEQHFGIFSAAGAEVFTR
jgi:hypothetical protein